jgi:hypothetical protein
MKTTKPYQYSEIITGTRITFHGGSIDEIVSDVMRIRIRNGKEVPDFNVLYNIISSKVSKTEQIDGPESKLFRNRTQGRNSHNAIKSRSVSISDASRAAKALMKIIPGDYVEESEYKRRLKICATCPLKQANSDCMGCGGSGKAARALLNVRAKLGLGYKMDGIVGRQFCGFCGCSLSLLLVTKVANYKIEDKNLNTQRPGHCWLRKDSINYAG